MKYEAVFGDQLAFDGMMPDCEFIVGTYGYKIKDGKCFYCEKYNHKYGWSPTGDAAKALSPVIAMRRIIKEPQWTKEDQNAGRLPEVGCSVLFTHNNFKCEVIAIDDSVTENVELALRFSDGSILVCKINKIKPIETPEEKAARLCNEWCKTAADIFVRHPSRSGTESMEGIYKAMLSGDLPVPVKDGE